MINIRVLLDAIDFEPNDEDAEHLHKYLNYELNGIEYDDNFKIKKYFRNLLIYVKTILS
jgi:hypothetical protein